MKIHRTLLTVGFAFAMAPIFAWAESTADEVETRQLYEENQELADLAVQVADQVGKTSRGQEIVEKIGKYLQNKVYELEGQAMQESGANRGLRGTNQQQIEYVEDAPSKEEVDDLLSELASFEEFQMLSESSSLFSGASFRGLEIGVAASFSLLLVGGEVGVGGDVVFKSQENGVTQSAQFKGREWFLAGGGVDLLFSVGIQLTAWFDDPVTEYIGAQQVDVVPVIGARFSKIDYRKSDSASETDVEDALGGKLSKLKNACSKVKADYTYTAGWSVRISLGLELGFMDTCGAQKTSKSFNKMTLDVSPESILFDTPTSLSVSLTHPQNRYGNYGLIHDTQLSLSLPSFLSATVSDIEFKNPSDSNWKQVAAIGGADPKLVFNYTGSGTTTWDSTLTFSLDNVKTTSSRNETGHMRAFVTNTADDEKVVPSQNATLAVVQTICTATIDWSTKLSGMSICEGDAATGSNQLITMTPTLVVGNNFMELTCADQTNSDSNPPRITYYNAGYVFEEVNEVPTISLYWWKKGTPFSGAVKGGSITYDQTMPASAESSLGSSSFSVTATKFECQNAP